MTKIPSVEEWKLRVEALHPTSFCNAHDIDELNWEHDKKGTIEMIEEAFTAERKAVAREEREKCADEIEILSSTMPRHGIPRKLCMQVVNELRKK